MEAPDDKARTLGPAHIILHGKLISMALLPTFDPWSQGEQAFSVEIKVGDGGVQSVRINVELDRPIPSSVRLLAILSVYDAIGCMRGLVLGYIGVDHEVFTYNRLGCFYCKTNLFKTDPLFSFFQKDSLDDAILSMPLLRIV